MWILNAHLIDYVDPEITKSLVSLEFDATGQLLRVQPNPPDRREGPILDVAGDYLSLGGVDLQINGALGVAFPDLENTEGSVAQLSKIGAFLWTQGIDAYAPTLVTTSVDKFQAALGCLAAHGTRPEVHPTAKILGAHLEGPCLNPQKRGAHPAQFLQPLTPEVLAAVVGDYRDQVAIVTLAPELDPTGQAIQWLKAQLPQAVVSLGHSLASDQDAVQAFERGATMVTHAFNAMPPLHHRNPGLLATALTTDPVWCGFIADGKHVAPRMLQLLIQACPHSGLFLVSDALSPLGLPDGEYPWDDRTITVTDGTARLPDGTLSGTTRPLLDGVINLVKWGCCSVSQAIALATDAPRRALGLPGIQPGLPLQQFLRWSDAPEPLGLTWTRLSNDMLSKG